MNKTSHSDKGLLNLLTKAWMYEAFKKTLCHRQTMRRHVQNHIRPFSGCRALDIGCGIGDILSYLPDSIGAYSGFDMNQNYIDLAKLRWVNKKNCDFFCQKVDEMTISEKGSYDIVIATGILHHLSDQEALKLFDLASQALKPGGKLVTYDNVYVEGQHWFARWLNSKDRGKAVRTIEGYKNLAFQVFSEIKGSLLHDTLRVPYTIFVMTCSIPSPDGN